MLFISTLVIIHLASKDCCCDKREVAKSCSLSLIAVINHILQIYSEITRGRVLSGEFYLSTDCFVKISLQSTWPPRSKAQLGKPLSSCRTPRQDGLVVSLKIRGLWVWIPPTIKLSTWCLRFHKIEELACASVILKACAIETIHLTL